MRDPTITKPAVIKIIANEFVDNFLDLTVTIEHARSVTSAYIPSNTGGENYSPSRGTTENDMLCA